MKRFLILQLRPETDAADGEYAALLDKLGLPESRIHRIRLDQENLPPDLDVTAYAGVIVGGGPGCVSDDPTQKKPLEARIEAQVMALMPQITARDHPYMGCCYGLGVLAKHVGGTVSKDQYGEPVGPAPCTLTNAGAQDPLTSGLPAQFDALVGHKEAVQALPPGCTHLIAAKTCPIQMIRWGQNVYATQFHPEADADDFEQRIRIYAHHGYFAPQDADALIKACHAADVAAPGQVLRRFAERYGR